MTTPTVIPVVCVARNNLALTRRAVKSILAQDMPTELFVIDNASTDGTAAWLSTREFVHTNFIDQRSLSACWNHALRVFWDLRHTEALVVNNDVEIRPDTARVLTTHGGEFVSAVSVGAREQLTTDVVDMDALRAGARPHPDFSCFLIRKSVTDAIGWFDEEMFPAYCEDIDYHVRMYRAGIRAMCVDLPFLHYRSSTLKHADAAEHGRIERGARANRERFRQKYGCLPTTPEYEKLFA